MEHKVLTKNSKKSSLFINKLKDNLESAKIEIVENYPCSSLRSLQQREREIFDKFNDENDGSYVMLNTIFNKKRKIRESVIDQERLEKIKLVENNEWVIIEDSNKQILRFKKLNPETKKIVDISISYKRQDKTEAKLKLIEKIDLKMNEQLQNKPGFIVEF